MSYEGYEQHICTNGHRFEVDAYDFEDDEPKCWCQADSVFCNCVDDTNAENYGVILPEAWGTLELTPEAVQTCNLGYQHITEQATYRVPTKDELLGLRSYWNCEDRKHYLLVD